MRLFFSFVELADELEQKVNMQISFSMSNESRSNEDSFVYNNIIPE